MHWISQMKQEIKGNNPIKISPPPSLITMIDQDFYRQRSQDEVNELMDSVFKSSRNKGNNNKGGRGGQWTTLVMMKLLKRDPGANEANIKSNRQQQPNQRLQEMVFPDNMTELTSLAVEHPTTMIGGSINSQEDQQGLDDSYYYYYGSRQPQSLSMEKNAFARQRRNFTDPTGAGHHHIESVEDLPPMLRAYDPLSINHKKVLPPLPADEQDIFFNHNDNDDDKHRRRSLASLLTFSQGRKRKEKSVNTPSNRNIFLSRPRRRPAPLPPQPPPAAPAILSSHLLEVIKSLPFINDTIFKPIERVAKLHPTQTVQNIIIIIEFLVALWAVYQLTMLVSATCQIVRSLCMPLVYAGKIMRCFFIFF